MDHSIYDKRGYPVVDVREGYGEWVRTYEQTVLDEMDVRLLETLRTVDWATPRQVLDLACGTGRSGAWLKRRCSAAIDGVDITPEMLAVARRTGVYRGLHVADVTRTGLPADTISASRRWRTSTSPTCDRCTRKRPGSLDVAASSSSWAFIRSS